MVKDDTLLEKINHLYLHVPFCKTICGYCDFTHRVYSRKTAEEWLFSLKQEIGEMCHGSYETIYLGGGTPTSLSSDELETLLSLIDPYRDGCLEYTIEVNPESLDEEKVLIMKKHGINRISMGVQSSSDRLLKMMGRRHAFEDVREKTALLRMHGLSNISVDLMYSLPGQTMDDLRESLEDVLSLDVPHISIYSLTIEEGTAFAKKGYTSLDEDTEADMYEAIRDTLTEKGYIQYEVSNYARPGYESKHNLGYWNYEDFLGVSLSAASKYGHKRITNTSSFADYQKGKRIGEVIELAKEDEMFEHVMMSFRKKEGLDLGDFRSRYGISFEEAYPEAIRKHEDELIFEKGHCRAKELGILHHILVDFLPD